MNFNRLILDWFDKCKRDLPWRNNQTPYNVWISEIMLQQTQVNQAINYFLQFISDFPSVQDLANGDESHVLKNWQGLGYYSRARNLHFTAKYVTEHFNGKFPNTFLELKKLKGIGDYTAAAIASICFDEVVPAIDGNAFRVFSRYLGLKEDIALIKNKPVFWEAGLALIDKKRPGDFNQAIMDLGATVCLPRLAKCDICPINESCYAFANEAVYAFPFKSKKIKTIHRDLDFLLITDGFSVLLKKRTDKDIWQNLFALPEKDIVSKLIAKDKIKNIWQLQHLLTHQKLNIQFFAYETNRQEFETLKNMLDLQEINPDNFSQFAIPKPIEKFFAFYNFERN